jgi:hypothetical protein
MIAMVGFGVALAIALAALYLGMTWPAGWQATIGAFTIVAGFVYFMQPQRLADLKMFHELFTKFNERYDALHDTLNQIANEESDTELTVDEKKALQKYCNLCAEEYFFHTHGYIYPDVWEAWLAGMCWFYAKSSRIRKFWDEELARNSSYYGMSMAILRDAGAS